MIDRPCLILCNFNEKEVKLLRTYANMMGLKDQIIVSWKNTDTLVKDILDNNVNSNINTTKVIKDRAIIFNCIPNTKVSMFIDSMKKMRISAVMKAVVTETSINWTLGELLENLIEERKAEKQGRTIKH